MACLSTALALCTSLAGAGYVVDGDTLRTDDGVYMRLLELDTPEKGYRAECDAERMLAPFATRYLDHILRDGFTIEDSGQRDRFRRPLIHARLPDGRTASAAVVAAGLGVVYAGRVNDWCGPS